MKASRQFPDARSNVGIMMDTDTELVEAVYRNADPDESVSCWVYSHKRSAASKVCDSQGLRIQASSVRRGGSDNLGDRGMSERKLPTLRRPQIADENNGRRYTRTRSARL